MASKKNNVDCYRLEKDVFAKTIAASRASAYALAIFSKNPLVGEAPPIPQQGRFAALPNALQVERLHALAGAEYGRDLTGGKGVCSQRPAGRADAPLGAMKKTAVGGSFMGFGVRSPTSVLQECVRSCPACHDCFRWNGDSHRA